MPVGEDDGFTLLFLMPSEATADQIRFFSFPGRVYLIRVRLRLRIISSRRLQTLVSVIAGNVPFRLTQIFFPVNQWVRFDRLWLITHRTDQWTSSRISWEMIVSFFLREEMPLISTFETAVIIVIIPIQMIMTGEKMRKKTFKHRDRETFACMLAYFSINTTVIEYSQVIKISFSSSSIIIQLNRRVCDNFIILENSETNTHTHTRTYTNQMSSTRKKKKKKEKNIYTWVFRGETSSH